MRYETRAGDLHQAVHVDTWQSVFPTHRCKVIRVFAIVVAIVSCLSFRSAKLSNAFYDFTLSIVAEVIT